MTEARQNNLLSITTTFNVNIMKSRYRLCCFYLLLLAFFLIILVNTPLLQRADIYLLIVVILAFSTVSIGVINARKSKMSLLCSFMLTSDGGISFSGQQCRYQLLPSSRYSFLGCWLIMKPIVMVDNSLNEVTNNRVNIKKYFIFRDSLNGQDFSQLTKVLNNLG